MGIKNKARLAKKLIASKQNRKEWVSLRVMDKAFLKFMEAGIQNYGYMRFHLWMINTAINYLHARLKDGMGKPPQIEKLKQILAELDANTSGSEKAS